MIELNKYIRESLLGNFEDIEASADPKKEIEEFIKDNYRIWGPLRISNEPNENGKYEVSCNRVFTKNKNITSLTNGMFEWSEIITDFSCSYCESLTSLEGAPKKVGGYFDCVHCNSLTNFKGAPEEVGDYFDCVYCNSLTSLEGASKKLGGEFNCSHCVSLTSLEGAPEKVGTNFYCANCKSLTSLEGAPKKVSGDFSCSNCLSLTSLKGAPKKIGGDFRCFGSKQDFTESDVRKICNVKGRVFVK